MINHMINGRAIRRGRYDQGAIAQGVHNQGSRDDLLNDVRLRVYVVQSRRDSCFPFTLV